MCSFGSCQTRFKFLSQFRKVRNAFECFVGANAFAKNQTRLAYEDKRGLYCIAGHESCDLRRYLDCVPPDTPLRYIVDRCRVWESHADPEVRRISKPMPEPVYPTYVVKQPDYETEPVCVVAVNKPNSPVDQNEELLKKLLAVLTPMVSSPARAPDLSPMDKLVQRGENRPLRRRPSLRA